MAGKAHGNGDRRGDNTICGLGDRLRRLTAGICLITQTIFPVMAAAPTHINPAHSDTPASASRRILMICSSEKRFFMGMSSCGL